LLGGEEVPATAKPFGGVEAPRALSAGREACDRFAERIGLAGSNSIVLVSSSAVGDPTSGVAEPKVREAQSDAARLSTPS